jgi:hypothetical protein
MLEASLTLLARSTVIGLDTVLVLDTVLFPQYSCITTAKKELSLRIILNKKIFEETKESI